MSAEARHTPGPLAVVKHGSSIDINTAVNNPAGLSNVASMNAGLDAEYALSLARMFAAAPDMLAALEAISSNPHCDLGSLVYKVRDSELEGWDGPAVTAWGNAVEAVTAVLAKVKGGRP